MIGTIYGVVIDGALSMAGGAVKLCLPSSHYCVTVSV